MADNARNPTVPNWLAGGLVALAAAAGVTVLIVAASRRDDGPRAALSPERFEELAAGASAAPTGMGSPPPSMVAGGGPPRRGAGAAEGSPEANGPSPLSMLVARVRQLELVQSDRLAIELSPGQRSEILAALEGLEDEEQLSDDEAQERLAALQGTLTDEQLAALEASRPSGGTAADNPQATPEQSPNPFRDETARAALESLRAALQSAE